MYDESPSYNRRLAFDGGVLGRVTDSSVGKSLIWFNGVVGGSSNVVIFLSKIKFYDQKFIPKRFSLYLVLSLTSKNDFPSTSRCWCNVKNFGIYIVLADFKLVDDAESNAYRFTCKIKILPKSIKNVKILSWSKSSGRSRIFQKKISITFSTFHSSSV